MAALAFRPDVLSMVFGSLGYFRTPLQSRERFLSFEETDSFTIDSFSFFSSEPDWVARPANDHAFEVTDYLLNERSQSTRVLTELVLGLENFLSEGRAFHQICYLYILFL